MASIASGPYATDDSASDEDRQRHRFAHPLVRDGASSQRCT
jgi:hypothetical protein